MRPFMIILSILLFIDCLMLIGVVLMQQSKASGLSGAITGMTDTYFGKNKARTLEGRLDRWTKILGAAFLVLSFVLYVVVSKMA